MIYFITARDIGRVKIGYSEAPYNRFRKIKADSPVALKFERVCAGGRAAEAALHERFSGCRVSGEWFLLSPEIESLMAQLPEPEKFLPKIAKAGPLGRWLADNGHTLATFAEFIGATPPTLSRICNGKAEPSARILRDIVRATNGEVTADEILFGEGGFRRERTA